MTRIFSHCVLALGILALAWAWLRAQDRPQPRTSGRVLILQNHRALEGEIERAGDRFILRRGNGELTVSAADVLCLCADWDEAFALVSRQANLRDPDERVRLARWCQMNGLHARALAEVQEALRLRKDHPVARSLLAQLQAVSDNRAAPASPHPAKEEGHAAPIDLSAETLSLFVGKVQPVLMNACATCHTTGRGGAFKLARCQDATLNRRSLHQNLAAVLAQVDLDQPAISPLLYKAVSAHGGAARAPLTNGRNSPPFRLLQEWVELVIANNPHLRKALAPRTATTKAPAAAPSPPAQGRTAFADPGPIPAAVQQVSSPPIAPEQPAPTPPGPQSAAGPVMKGVPADRGPQQGPGDEYDAAIFNTRMHPQR